MIWNWREKTARELGRTANHIYLAPHALLHGKVAHYTVWTATEPGGQPLSGGESSCQERGSSAKQMPEQEPPAELVLVPDAAGCIVMHLDNGLRANMWGATTRAVTVSDAGAPVRLFVEFLPGGLYHFTGACQTELADGIFTLDAVAPHFFRSLTLLLERAQGLTELAEGFDALLLPIMLAHTPPPAALSAIEALGRLRGMLSVRELSMREGYSPRHLNRVLGLYLGMGPKEYARLLRVNTTMKRLNSKLPLTFLAQEGGFYDQAHFIRDFKIICGVTPGFCRDNMSDFYKEPFKL